MTSFSSIPATSVTAETVNGFAISQKDHAGIVTTASRAYTATGIRHTQTDARGTTWNGGTANDVFAHNSRSELASAQVNGTSYAYDYDNIGNRTLAVEEADSTAYEANNLNQFSSISENGERRLCPAVRCGRQPNAYQNLDRHLECCLQC